MANCWPEIDSSESDKRRELKVSGKILSARLENDNSIPTTLFAKMPALNFLELSESPLLQSIPNELRQLSCLTNLILQGNHLERLPDSLGELKKLKFMDVSRNRLIELPSSIGGCVELQTLNVAHNQLGELPSSLSECGHLVNVDGSHNQFESFPTSLIGPKLPHLGEIILKSNRIGDIPIKISDLPALKSLDLADNKILVVPGELGDCSKLKDLQLRGNELTDRRLRKLIDDGVQKAILDYVRKNCVKTSVKKPVPKSKATKMASKKEAPASTSPAGAEEGNDDQIDTTDKIIILPARSETKIIWRKDVAEVRPHLLCCIVKDLDFSEPKKLREFLNLQTKIHENQCHRRVDAAIATHDLLKVRFPLAYTAKTPEEITIHPLGRAKDTTAANLVGKLTAEAEELRKERKRPVYSGIHQYLYLVKDKPKYSCLIDADNRVVSFPPITNSDTTKISNSTKHVLVEVSSDKDLATCKRAMDALIKGIFATMIPANLPGGHKCMNMEQVKVEAEDDTLKTIYPSKIDLTDLGDGVEIVRDWSKGEAN